MARQNAAILRSQGALGSRADAIDLAPPDIWQEHLTKVIHSFPVWLPQTQTWMCNQVRFLPESVETHVEFPAERFDPSSLRNVSAPSSSN